MLQNISQKRDNKAITLTDFKFIRCATALSIYNGTSGYAISGSNSSACRRVGHFMSLYVYYVQGTDKNKGKCLWRWDSGYQNTTPSNSDSYNAYNDNSYAVVRYSSKEVSTNSIYKDLTIEKGEEKIIVEVSLRTGLCKYADGTNISSHPIKNRFGFNLITPKCPTPAKNGSHFHSIVVFTPKKGLFSSTAPK